MKKMHVISARLPDKLNKRLDEIINSLSLINVNRSEFVLISLERFLIQPNKDGFFRDEVMRSRQRSEGKKL